jgi:hypothetical protein
MKWLIRIVAVLFFSVVFFGAIQHYFQLNSMMSLFLALVGAVFTSLAATFDFGKKWYDFRKGPYELRKLKREEEAAEGAKSSVISRATPDEMKMYGQSPTERAIKERFKNAGPDALKPKRFVVDSREEKL